jgi:ribosomal protein L37E
VKDQHLKCPGCGYNLTALRRNVCPECGKPFDPRHLEGMQRKYDGVIELPRWLLRYGGPLLVLAVAAGLLLATGRIFVWVWGIGLGTLFVAAIYEGKGPMDP